MPTAPTRTLLQIIKSMETLSGIYLRDEFFRVLAAHSLAVLRGRMAILYRVVPGVGGHELVPLGWCVAEGNERHWEEYPATDTTLPADPFLTRCLAPGKPLQIEGDADGWRLGCSLSVDSQARLLLDLYTAHSISRTIQEGLDHFFRCFENQLRHWEYANLDTLTHLLNRKTFDEQFEQLIAEAGRAQVRADERRDGDLRGDLHGNRPCWLGVVDIDHFKRVNDSFGHLFGDEVLILVSQLLRNNFRTYDKLFRFGGEEFVVMLRNATEEDVKRIFERFRAAVETYDFPQLGRVTVSLGYARIDPSRTPAELLGRADDALYFAKGHGRNQIRSFDELVTQGELKLATPGSGTAQADADTFFE